MKTLTALSTALLTAASISASAPAAAVQVTWYVTGHMAAALPGTPADLLALAPEGAVFTASFSFDSAMAANPLYFTSSRTDFVTSSALGAAALDVNGSHFSSSGSSRIIEQADFNGESVDLNGGAVTGPSPARYAYTALDVLQIGHSGFGTDSNAVKYPWFSPFGSGGTFIMISAAAPPNLALSDYPAMLDLFFGDANGGTDHRQGLIEAISTVPFPVPEPGSWALMLAGAAAVALTVQRKQHLG
jgi:hypothetical protein